jgi:hypothetical protein
VRDVDHSVGEYEGMWKAPRLSQQCSSFLYELNVALSGALLFKSKEGGMFYGLVWPTLRLWWNDPIIIVVIVPAVVLNVAVWGRKLGCG